MSPVRQRLVIIQVSFVTNLPYLSDHFLPASCFCVKGPMIQMKCSNTFPIRDLHLKINI
jgi:hypothetical protein